MATIWILVALVGGLLAVAGFFSLARKYRRGEIRGRYLLAVGVALVSFTSYALLSAFAPTVVHGVAALAVLLPALVALVVIVREHELGRRGGRPAE